MNVYKKSNIFRLPEQCRLLFVQRINWVTERDIQVLGGLHEPLLRLYCAAPTIAKNSASVSLGVSFAKS